MVEMEMATRALRAVGSVSPNPSPMIDKEKNKAANEQLFLCDCEYLVVNVRTSSFEFECGNKTSFLYLLVLVFFLLKFNNISSFIV